jgi:hypothetical protein
VRRHSRRALVGRIIGVAAALDESTPIERRFALAVGRMIALFAGLVWGLIAYRSGQPLSRAIAEGVADALAIGLAAGFFTISVRTTPTEVLFDARRGAGVFLRHMLFGLLTGLGAGVAVGLLVNSSFGLVVGLALGTALGVVDGLNVWLDVPTDVTRALSPRSTRRADRAAALARSATAAITIGVTSGLAFDLAYGPGSGVMHGLAFGIGFGLADRYAGIGATAWGRYLIAKAWLGAAGYLPWRLMAFLDDLHDHEILRRTGATYQFRHGRLQEYLAGLFAEARVKR